jgi:hypothetical protein
MDDILSLHKKPPTEKGPNEVPQFQDFVEGAFQQADLLFLPEDQGYKYLLVCVDDSTRKVDAQPLKDKLSNNVVKAFKKIYSRKILKIPQHIELDAGKEFKGATESYFNTLGIKIRYAETARHRQQALVEAKNHIIGKLIFILENHEELKTHKQCKEWVKFLPKIIDEINKHIKESQPNPKKPISDFPLSDKSNQNLLAAGTLVRVLLDHPIEVYNQKRLIGDRFRAGDIRYRIKTNKITNVLLRPGFPPLYTVDDGTTVQHTRQQLQVMPHFV